MGTPYTHVNLNVVNKLVASILLETHISADLKKSKHLTERK